MRIIELLLLSMFLVWMSSCTEECKDPCLFEDNTRKDTIHAFGLDTTLIMGNLGDVVVFEDDFGAEMIFEVVQHETTFFPTNELVACGSCGDSVWVETFRSLFMYEMISEEGLRVSIDLNSDKAVVEPNRRWRCTEGKVTFADTLGASCSTFFIAECNGFLTPKDGERLNKELYQLSIDSTALLACSPADTTYVHNCPTGDVDEFYLNDSIPIGHFRLRGECWHFSEVRPK